MREPGEHPVFARIWARQAETAAPIWRRRELVAGLTGRVVEVGCGDGCNFRHYPSSVGEVVAIEPEPYLRRRAQRAAQTAPVRVTVTAGAAEALPVDDASCDAVITSLVLCSVVDQPAALAEIRRVLRPSGELRFYEHVIAHNALGAAAQHRADAWGIWPRLAGGCHMSRDTLNTIAAAGLRVERLSRFPSGPGRFGLPVVAGIARLT